MFYSDREPYPVTIFPARYGGTYEGASWIALNEFTRSEAVAAAQDSDIECMDFYHNYQGVIGRGCCPQHAYENLCSLLAEKEESTNENLGG